MHSFRVLDYFTNLSQIVVRYSIADQPNNSVTEGAIDAFRIDDISCTTATWTTFGSGCAGNNGTPSMSLVSLPAMGGTLALDIQNLAGGAAFIATGLGTQNLPLQQYGFGSGCSLLVTTDAVQFLAQAGGTAAWSLAIPNNSAFAGLHIYNQVVEFGGTSAASAGGDGEIQ